MTLKITCGTQIVLKKNFAESQIFYVNKFYLTKAFVFNFKQLSLFDFYLSILTVESQTKTKLKSETKSKMFGL
jgi:hypothetical protein